jgi:hypothetical protein
VRIFHSYPKLTAQGQPAYSDQSGHTLYAIGGGTTDSHLIGAERHLQEESASVIRDASRYSALYSRRFIGNQLRYDLWVIEDLDKRFAHGCTIRQQHDAP